MTFEILEADKGAWITYSYVHKPQVVKFTKIKCFTNINQRNIFSRPFGIYSLKAEVYCQDPQSVKKIFVILDFQYEY